MDFIGIHVFCLHAHDRTIPDPFGRTESDILAAQKDLIKVEQCFVDLVDVVITF